MNLFYQDLGLKQNDPFVIRMDTCDFPASPVSYEKGQEPPLLRLRQSSGDLNMEGSEVAQWVRDPRSESEGYVIFPLEASETGDYTGTVALSSNDSLTDVCLIDSSGETLWNSPGTWTNGDTALQYRVQDGTQDLFVAAKASTTVSINASFTSTRSSPSPSPSRSQSRRSISFDGYASAISGGISFWILWNIFAGFC